MASIKLVLRKSKTLADGTHPIAIRFTVHRKSKFIFTGKSSLAAHWDDKQGLPNKKHPLASELKIYLLKRKRDAEVELLGLQNQDANLTATLVKEKVKKSKVDKAVFPFFDATIADLKKSGQVSTRRNYNAAKNMLLDFMKGSQSLQFSEIDLVFLRKYDQYMIAKGFKMNTRYCYLSKLKALFTLADIPYEKSPFKDFQIAHLKKDEVEHRALDKSSLKGLLSYKAEEGSPKFYAMVYFTFSYYCWGMNFTDIAHLKWKNIYSGRLTYNRSKTNKLYNIELLEPALKILEYFKIQRYGQEGTPNGEDFVFPIIDPAVHNTPEKLKNVKQNKLSKINEHLKKIAKELKIPADITSYWARHSFATHLRDLDISTAKIQTMLGHTTEEMTQVYLDSIKNNELDNAAKQLLL
ncbi:MAG: site-specific integrase [Bacteroidetes bacterium]|nr:MAG: site-specific integrase [Bacteroidota bacterium]